MAQVRQSRPLLRIAQVQGVRDGEGVGGVECVRVSEGAATGGNRWKRFWGSGHGPRAKDMAKVTHKSPNCSRVSLSASDRVRAVATFAIPIDEHFSNNQIESALSIDWLNGVDCIILAKSLAANSLRYHIIIRAISIPFHRSP